MVVHFEQILGGVAIQKSQIRMLQGRKMKDFAQEMHGTLNFCLT